LYINTSPQAGRQANALPPALLKSKEKKKKKKSLLASPSNILARSPSLSRVLRYAPQGLTPLTASARFAFFLLVAGKQSKQAYG